ncbi:MAG: HAD family hydrolase [Flavobacteriales bacterium]|nr:HAD family hydrolase [Flavobacteriales bacterium]
MLMKMPEFQQHLFFDLDRTLWDHYAANEQTMALLQSRYVEVLGGRDLASISREFRHINDHLWTVIQDKGLRVSYVKKRRMLHWLQSIELSLSGREMNQLSSELETLYTATMPYQNCPFPHVLSTLEALRAVGHTLHIITNGTLEAQSKKLETMGIQGYFDGITTSDQCKAYKPRRAIFAHALNRSNVRAEDAWMIGDSWERDILGAQAIGMRTAWFNPNHQSKPKTDPQPDIEFHDWKAFHLSLPSKT